MDDAVESGRAERGSRRPDAASWREILAPYARPDLRRSGFDVATSVVAYLALTAAMYAALDVSLLLVLAFAVPAAGFLVADVHRLSRLRPRLLPAVEACKPLAGDRLRARRLFALSQL